MKKFKFILKLILGLSFFAPAFAYATTTIPWFTTNLTSIFPSTVNGANPFVGIGTKNADAHLHVAVPFDGNNALHITDDTGAVDNLLIRDNGTLLASPSVNYGGTVYNFGGDTAAAVGSAPFFLVNPSASNSGSPTFGVTLGTTNQFIITGDGNVGINNSNPSALLSLDASISNTKINVFDDGITPAGLGYQGDGLTFFNSGINKTFWWLPSPTTATTGAMMNVDPNHGLGIGSSSPSAHAISAVGGTGCGAFSRNSAFADTSNNEIFTITSCPSVGISTTSPWKTFSVNGDMVLTGAFFDSLSKAGSNGMVLQSTGSATKWVATSTLGITATNYWTLNGTTITNNNGGNAGLVGVGTSSPWGQLSASTTGAIPALAVQTIGTNYAASLIGASQAPPGSGIGGDLVLGSPQNVTASLSFGHFNGNYAWTQSWGGLPWHINDYGNNVDFCAAGTPCRIGINTNAPFDDLDVSHTSSGTTGGRIVVSNTAANANGNSSEIAFKSGTDFVATYYTGAIAVQQTSALNSNDAMIFRLYNGAGSSFGDEKMRIVQTGNVGIGTTSPFTKLSVAGTIIADNINATSTTANSAFAGTVTVGNPAPAVVVALNTTGLYSSGNNFFTGAICGSSCSGNQINMGLGNAMDFKINNVSTLYLSSSNNVGIGQSSPTASLEIATSTGSGNSSILRLNRTGAMGANEEISLDFFNTSPYNSGRIASKVDPTGTGWDMALSTKADTGTALAEVMRLTRLGLVGIGTSTPFATLSVQSGASTGDALVIATSSGATIGGYDNDGHRYASGPKPAISSCGTGTGTVVGDDQTGDITTASVAVSCTLTFAKAYQKAPVCTISTNSLGAFGDISSVSTSAVTFGISSALTGGHLYYSCVYHR